MFFNRDIFLKNATKNKALFEYSFTELKNNSDAGRKSRAKGIKTNYAGISQGPDGQTRVLFNVPSQTDSGTTYQVTVAVIVPKSNLFQAVKAMKRNTDLSTLLKNADVKVHCTCMDFLMGGQKYNLGPQGKYKGSTLTDKTKPSYKTLEPTPPDQRDPERVHVLCKHCIAVATSFAFHAVTIFKDVKKFIPEVQTNDKTTKDMDDGKKPLKKDIELVDLDQEKTNKITEGLVHGAEGMIDKEESTLSKNNKTPEESGSEVKDIVEEKPVEEVPEIKPSGESEKSEVSQEELTNQPSPKSSPKTDLNMYDENGEMLLKGNKEVKPEIGQKVVPELDKNVKKPEEVSEPIKMDSDLNVKDGSEVVLDKDKGNKNATENTRDVKELIGKQDEVKSDGNQSTNIYKRPTSI